MYLSRDPFPIRSQLYRLLQLSLCVLIFAAARAIATLPELQLPCLDAGSSIHFRHHSPAVQEARKYFIYLMRVLVVLLLTLLLQKQVLLILVLVGCFDPTLIKRDLLHYPVIRRFLCGPCVLPLQDSGWLVGLRVCSLASLLPHAAHDCGWGESLIDWVQLIH